ncbi:hypothetical protein Glove_21g51 [Diversispora epigaea]|uniref:Uncharacterized protein n=1 Tax=Diversispora epigaea TaxID=1348612 RepID=A0A397JK65_9GLOM|nr:hypothetical protein Glove_21g51 [Diversispora epigaea]
MLKMMNLMEELTLLSFPLQDGYMKNPDYFDSLIDNIDLSYIGGEAISSHSLSKKKFRSSSLYNDFDDFTREFDYEIYNSAILRGAKYSMGNGVVKLDQSEIDFFDKIGDLKAQPRNEYGSKSRKLWCKQQFVASSEKRRVNQDPNNDRFNCYFTNRTNLHWLNEQKLAKFLVQIGKKICK